MSRTLIWFSAGAASAVAAKLVLDEGHDNVVVAYTDPGSEHPDNVRFLAECEMWFGHEIVRLRSAQYVDTWQVWAETRFLVSPAGARCTAELKKKVRFGFQLPDDVQVFGYTAEEEARANRFRQQNPDVDLRTPLIERGVTKAQCLGVITSAGIELPAMYQLGYRNNNCIGCPKGGMGYWNMIRRDFPDTFYRMARLERDLNHTVLREEIPDQPGRKTRPVWLDELDPERGNMLTEPDIECSILCASGDQ